MSIHLTFEPFIKRGKHVLPGTCLLFTMIKELYTVAYTKKHEA